MRLIEVDKLLAELRMSFKWHAENSRELSLLQRDINIVKEQPTVDAVPVIRCKDCIHFKYDADCFGDCMLDGGIVRTIYSNDFCSWAERKEE